jgi:ribosomal protein S18 acetylase RimI-like enzyme
MPSVRIKEFVPQDNAEEKEALLPIFLKIWNAPENLKYLSQTMKPFAPELVRIWLENHKDQGGRYFCALNEQNNILGIMVVKENPVEGFEIYGLGILPKHKGMGVGRKLVEHAATVAEEHDFKDINALVFADNTAMLCLLLISGYTPVSMEHHKRSDGTDAVYLKKYIGITRR